MGDYRTFEGLNTCEGVNTCEGMNTCEGASAGEEVGVCDGLITELLGIEYFWMDEYL